MASTNEITAWDPPNQTGYKSIGGSMPFETLYTLAARENGTQLSVHGKLEIGGFFKMAKGIAGRLAKKQLNTDFEALKRYLEEGQAQASRNLRSFSIPSALFERRLRA